MNNNKEHDNFDEHHAYKAERRVIKNSLWMIIQPLALNVLSIFAIGYIARTLGQEDYGKFVFAFSFIGLFSPILNLGLRAVTVREVAQNKDQTSVFMGKMTILKLVLSCVAVILTIIAINCLNYPQETKFIVYLASLIIIFNALTATFNDVFQAYERMKFVALSQMISGLTLTFLSIIVLFLGFRLIGVTSAYVIGNFIALIITAWLLKKHIGWIKPKFDLEFSCQNIKHGFPFFLPNFIDSFGQKIGIIILSKFGGDASLGFYGAAVALTAKLAVVIDGIASAYYPTMAVAFKESKTQAVQLFRKFFQYLFIIGLPVALGGTVLSKPIILLVYGSKYYQAINILIVAAWTFPIVGLTSFLGWTHGAIGNEKKLSVIKIVYVSCFLISCIVLIPLFHALGLAYASLIGSTAALIISFYFLKKKLLGKLFCFTSYSKIFMVNIIVGICIYFIRDWSIFITLPLYILLYLSLIVLFRIIKFEEIMILVKSKFIKK